MCILGWVQIYTTNTPYVNVVRYSHIEIGNTQNIIIRTATTISRMIRATFTQLFFSFFHNRGRLLLQTKSPYHYSVHFISAIVFLHCVEQRYEAS